MTEYKGFIGEPDYDDEGSIFHGEVINSREVIRSRNNMTFIDEEVVIVRHRDDSQALVRIQRQQMRIICHENVGACLKSCA